MSRVSYSRCLPDAQNRFKAVSRAHHGPWPEGLLRFAGFLKTL